MGLLRTCAFLVMMLPALLLPKGIPMALCLCGSGFDASICDALVGVHDPGPFCGCCSAQTLPCEGEECAPGTLSTVAAASHCPDCQVVAIDAFQVDFTDSVERAVLDINSGPCIAWVASIPQPSWVCNAQERGRAPPPSPTLSPGLWPSVLPLRI